MLRFINDNFSYIKLPGLSVVNAALSPSLPPGGIYKDFE